MAVATSAIAVGAGLSAYSARQQRKAGREAAAAQQQGIDQAQQFSEEAARQATGTLSPLATLTYPGITTMRNLGSEFTNIGREGLMGMRREQAPLNIGQFVDLPGTVQRQNEFQGVTRSGIQGLQSATSQPLNVGEFLNPGMQFAMQQGQEAIQGSLAARGLSRSGAALKELTQFGQGLATQNYNTAVQQAMASRGQQMQGLGNLADIGARGEGMTQQNIQTGIQQAMANRAQQVGIAGDMMSQGATGANIQQNLMNTGVNALGQQANIAAMQGTNAGNLAMTSGNVAAAQRVSQPDILNNALQGGMGMAMIGATMSDEDMKKIDGAISDEEIEEFLNNLEPAQYEYVDDALDKMEEREDTRSEGKKVGVMAQDVEKSKIGKQMVMEDEDGTKMLDGPQSIGALLATAASLNRRLKKLENK